MPDRQRRQILSGIGWLSGAALFWPWQSLGAIQVQPSGIAPAKTGATRVMLIGNYPPIFACVASKQAQEKGIQARLSKLLPDLIEGPAGGMWFPAEKARHVPDEVMHGIGHAMIMTDLCNKSGLEESLLIAAKQAGITSSVVAMPYPSDRFSEGYLQQLTQLTDHFVQFNVTDEPNPGVALIYNAVFEAKSDSAINGAV